MVTIIFVSLRFIRLLLAWRVVSGGASQIIITQIRNKYAMRWDASFSAGYLLPITVIFQQRTIYKTKKIYISYMYIPDINFNINNGHVRDLSPSPCNKISYPSIAYQSSLTFSKKGGRSSPAFLEVGHSSKTFQKRCGPRSNELTRLFKSLECVREEENITSLLCFIISSLRRVGGGWRRRRVRVKEAPLCWRRRRTTVEIVA